MLIVDIAARHFIYLIYIDTGETDCLPTNYEKTTKKTSSDTLRKTAG